MATRKTQLFASLVLDLMADDKERTLTQISSELGATSAQTRWALTRLLAQRDVYICRYLLHTHAKVYRICPIRSVDATQHVDFPDSGSNSKDSHTPITDNRLSIGEHLRYRSRGTWLLKANPSWSDEDRTLTAAMFAMVRAGRDPADVVAHDNELLE
jgi:hypothetical protein